MTAVDDAADVIAQALDVSNTHPAVPIEMPTRVAEALAAAGLLRDGETRTEWGLRYADARDPDRVWVHDEDDARRWAAANRDGSLWQRTVYPERVTEWKPVES